MLELVSLVYSPWSEKARWALRHHGIEFRETPYSPLVDELNLRWRTGRWRGRFTVPVFFTGERWLTDSWEIAMWADQQGAGSPLLPEPQRNAIRWYNALSESGLAAGRAGLRRVLGNDRWLRALVPPAVAPVLGPLAPHVAAFGLRHTLRKYGAVHQTPEQHRQRLRHVLQTVRETLATQVTASGPATLLGQFSYADIAVAQILQMVEPVNRGGFRLGEEGRRGYRDPELAEEFEDLCRWRLALYETYHPDHSAREAA